jgi:hypothetical protein
MTTYTIPKSEVSYNDYYPKIIEFEKPWETSIRVGQGKGCISKMGIPFQSEGFSKCFGLILRNRSNLESALFHVDDIDLNHNQTPIIEELMKNYITHLNIDYTEKNKLLGAITDITHYNYSHNYEKITRKDFQLRMEQLNSDRTIQACFVRGDESRDIKSRIVGSLLGHLGINVVDDLIINTGKQHWAMVYKPNKSEIYVDAKNQKKVLTFMF